jgi:hypothetical protein
MTDATEPTAEAEEGAEEQPPPFENRAARRAKGKKGSAQHTHDSAGHIHGRSGTVQGPRQYGNRRSG